MRPPAPPPRGPDDVAASASSNADICLRAADGMPTGNDARAMPGPGKAETKMRWQSKSRGARHCERRSVLKLQDLTEFHSSFWPIGAQD